MQPLKATITHDHNLVTGMRQRQCSIEQRINVTHHLLMLIGIQRSREIPV